MRQYSYALNTKARHYKDLSILAKEPAFRNATTVYPVQTPEDFYRLHAYYSKVSTRCKSNIHTYIYSVKTRVTDSCHKRANSVNFSKCFACDMYSATASC